MKRQRDPPTTTTTAPPALPVPPVGVAAARRPLTLSDVTSPDLEAMLDNLEQGLMQKTDEHGRPLTPEAAARTTLIAVETMLWNVDNFPTLRPPAEASDVAWMMPRRAEWSLVLRGRMDKLKRRLGGVGT